MKKTVTITIILALVALGGLLVLRTGNLFADESNSEEMTKTNQPVNDMAEKDMGNMKKAMFAAGCFWGVEAIFQEIDGVVATRVGFSGGHTENPTYKEVCYHNTGHAETVEVTYDPNVVSYEDLLTVFWAMHDPTTLDRQGPDVGDQYRSAIFYFDEAQKEAAEKSKKELDASGKYNSPVVTEITAAGPFYPAEEYHQDYYKKKGVKPTCHYIPEGLLKAKKE